MKRLPLWVVGLAVAFVWAIPLLAGRSHLPFGQIRAMAPWDEPSSVAWDILRADGVLQFYVWRDLVFEAWGDGRLPLWNPYQLAGTPLLANSQSAGFYPPHIVIGVLGLPTLLGINLLAIFHGVVAALGAAWLARRLGAGDSASTLAGAAFGISPFFLAWAALPSVMTTCAWIPWLLGATVGLVQCEGRAWGKWAGALAGATAMTLLGGHLQFAAYGLMAAALVGLVTALGSRRPVRLAGILAGLVVGGMLAAPQVLPALEYGKFSHRRGAPTAEGYSAFLNGAIQPFEWPLALFPGLGGLPHDTFRLEDGTLLPGHWPMFVKRGANFAESAMAFGPVLLFLLLALRRERWKEPAVLGAGAVGLLGLLIAWGTPLNALMYFGVPGWSATGSPGRAGILVVLAVAVLAAVGLEHLRWDRSRLVPGATAGVLGLLALMLPMLAFTGLPSWLPGGFSIAPMVANAWSSGAPWALVGLAVLALVVLAPKKAGLEPWVVTIAAVGALVVPLGLLFQGSGVGLQTAGKPSEAPLAPRSDPNRRYAFVNADWSLFGPAPTLLFPNTASALRLRDIAGYDSLLHRDTVALLRELNSGQDAAPQANGNIMLIKPGYDPAALADAGVSVVYSLLPGGTELGPDQTGFRVPIYATQLDGPGRASVDGRPATVLTDGPDHVVVRAQGPGTLTLRDRMMPGWSAEVGGKPVSLPEGRWRTVEIPAGEQDVRFTYDPPGLNLGLILALVGCGELATLLLWSRLRPKAAA